IRQFGNSAIRQFGNSAIRQFGNSAIRQFGNSLNRSLTLAFLLAWTLTVSVRAQWTGAGVNISDYNAADNWTDGAINHQFIGSSNITNSVLESLTFAAGSTVLYTGTFNANKLYVGQQITGAGLAAGTVVTAINNAGQITVSAAATDDSAGSYTAAGWGTYARGSAYALNFTQNTVDIAGPVLFLNDENQYFRVETQIGTVNANFSNPNAAFVVDLGGASSQNFLWGSTGRDVRSNFSGNVTFYVNPTVFNNTGLNTFYLNSKTTLAGDLHKSGAGTLTVNGNATQTVAMSGGKVTVDGGALIVATNSAALTGARIAGAGGYDVINSLSTLTVDTTSLALSQTTGVNLLEEAPVNLYSGVLKFAGNGNGVINEQSVGAVTANGRVALGFDTTTSNGFTLTLESLTRANNATVNLTGLASGGGHIVISGNDDNIVSSLVGGTTGVSGVTNLKIIPWISANGYNHGVNAAARMYAGADLVTYTTGTGAGAGFRVLADNEYFSDLAGAAADDNVKIATAAQTLATSTTINALRNITSTSTVTLNSDVTLTVDSGVIINAQRAGFTVTGGTVSSGARAFVFNGQETITSIYSNLTNTVSDGAVGAIFAQVGSQTRIYGTNSWGGATLVQGSLLVYGNGALPNTTDVRVDRGGSLLINAGNAWFASLAGIGSIGIDGSQSTVRISIGGDGSSNAYGGITVNAGGIIAPGDASGEFQAGTLFMGNQIGHLTFKADGVLALDFASDTVSDQIAVALANTSAPPTLRFDDGAIISVNLLGTYTPTTDTDWLLTTGFASISGDLNNVLLQNSAGTALDSELWSLSNLGGNLLLSYTIPEPSTWLLLTIGAGTLLFTIRRRR
ncbi:MAG: PEP-CTERM sorting domain-containing protein, partial [Verrucomicrobiales bacterium]|nr:PEP-CTERM sorting domain-containing protein [Verrucomicrobiales bacterium]